ncbi:MAG: aminoacetone oxidase family FAD-binding enzyme, partial [Candidatus Omnitrophica bacterium]|nr:aminoacetone oxidase family FAD-binding enzyme [Candidatus Omnitrophota bacterium]
NTEVLDVFKDQEGVFNVVTNKEILFSEKVIITTGGLSYRATGSTGAGLIFAEKLGHTIITVKPALVGIETSNVKMKNWQGISLKNVACSILQDGKKVSSYFGEMLFTHYGLSGPIILDLSAIVYDIIMNNKKIEASIDLKPALTIDKLNARMLREFKTFHNKQLLNILKELLPGKMSILFLEHVKIDPKKPVNQVTRSEREQIVRTLKDLRFTIKRTRPIEEAIITRGGISTKEIDPKTMESKICKGLYFAGEVIDIDAKTGGYNLQAAFSTGFVAGMNI